MESYRTAMFTWKGHICELECDFTQRIHTMEGLDELMKLGHCPCSRVISDDNLLTKVSALLESSRKVWLGTTCVHMDVILKVSSVCVCVCVLTS